MSTKIIGYIHVCQKGEWKRSFDMIFNFIQNYGLYDNTLEIRCGVVNDFGKIIEDERLKDKKIKIIHVGKSDSYERPTLIHMRSSCEKDGLNTKYWYLHTKGLRHFNTPKESFVVDWIKLMLYWNIQKWKLALDKLNTYDTYGCEELLKYFYSGNFWWANASHIKKLPIFISDEYTAPESWILTINDKMYNVFSSNIQGQGHYEQNYPEINYYLPEDRIYISIPEDFNVLTYKNLNSDLINLTKEQCLEHYLIFGINENRKYIKTLKNNSYSNKIPNDFDVEYYKNYYNDLKSLSDEQLKEHWIMYGQKENRIYKKLNEIGEDFDHEYYRNNYEDLSNLSNSELESHWINAGKFQNRLYRDYSKLPKDFNPTIYKKLYSDLLNLTDEELKTHWLNNGRFENRKYK
jgi:hypothetical protein